MNIGIIGSGNMGAAIGKRWASKGHQVMFSFSQDSAKLTKLAAHNHFTQQGTVAEAAAFGEVIMLAVPPSLLGTVLQDKALFAKKTLITCVSGLRPDFTGETLGLATQMHTSIAEQIAALLPDTHVVEAFNSTFAQVIAEPFFEAGDASVFYCGDDKNAKETAARLIRDCGFKAVNVGSLLTARSLETLSTAWVQLAVVGGIFPRVALNAIR